jgi:hypothetical protein
VGIRLRDQKKTTFPKRGQHIVYRYGEPIQIQNTGDPESDIARGIELVQAKMKQLLQEEFEAYFGKATDSKAADTHSKTKDQ